MLIYGTENFGGKFYLLMGHCDEILLMQWHSFITDCVGSNPVKNIYLHNSLSPNYHSVTTVWVINLLVLLLIYYKTCTYDCCVCDSPTASRSMWRNLDSKNILENKRKTAVFDRDNLPDLYFNANTCLWITRQWGINEVWVFPPMLI